MDMDEARSRVQWIHTSSILAQIINSNPFREGEAVTPESQNPWAAVERREEPKLEITWKQLRYRWGYVDTPESLAKEAAEEAALKASCPAPDSST